MFGRLLCRSSVFVVPTRCMGTQRARAPKAPKEKQRVFRKRVTLHLGPKFWEENVGTLPTDDVWKVHKHAPVAFSLAEILSMHREFSSPEMLDNSDGIVVLEAFLDKRTRKKTKFMSQIKQTLLLPHYFDDGTDNRILAFCKQEEDKEIALESGAAFAGGVGLIKQVEKGDIKYHDYDYVVCTLDILPEVATIRKHLRDVFPNQKKGTLGSDIKSLVHNYRYGKTYESEKLEDAIGSVKLKLGKLSMTDEELQGNLDAYIESICSLRSPALGRFILCGRISVPPSAESFRLHSRALLPAAQRLMEEEKELEQEEEEVVEAADSDDEADETKVKAKR